jgi:hypothetical protein
MGLTLPPSSMFTIGGMLDHPAPGPSCSIDGCSLDEAALAATAASAERDGDTMRFTLEAATLPAVLPVIAELIAAESDCCPASRFTLEVAAGQALLTAEIPGLAAAC